MHVCMVHISMIRLKFCYERTDGRTNKAILGVGFWEDIYLRELFMGKYLIVGECLFEGVYLFVGA